MSKVSLPRYLRFGVRTNKPLEQVRREALEAERYERRRVWRSRLGAAGDFLGGVLNVVLPSKLSCLMFINFILHLIGIPFVMLIGVVGVPVLFMVAYCEEGGRQWPWNKEADKPNF